MHTDLLKQLSVITPEEQRFLNGETDIDRDIYSLDKSNIIHSKSFLGDKKLIAVRPHTRFVHFPEHSHDYVEAIYMCSGQTTHIINGSPLTLKTGGLLFLTPRARQEILPAGMNDIAINFVIRPPFFQQALTMMDDDDSPVKRFVLNTLVDSTSATGYLHFEISDILPIQNTIETLVWTLLSKVPDRRKINQTAMGFLLLLLMDHTDRITHKSIEEDLIIKTLSYIEDNYINGSLKVLADNLHYDYAWLSREIKKHTGKTYTELVQEKRLSQSCWMLKNTRLNVDEIARNVGYENVSYFHRAFQKKYKTSPRKYRIDASCV